MNREERKKEKKMGEMVGDQTANQAAKPLKKGKKEKKICNSRIADLVVLLLLYCPVLSVCVS
jgi:hypothetical protein